MTHHVLRFAPHASHSTPIVSHNRYPSKKVVTVPTSKGACQVKASLQHDGQYAPRSALGRGPLSKRWPDHPASSSDDLPLTFPKAEKNSAKGQKKPTFRQFAASFTTLESFREGQTRFVQSPSVFSGNKKALPLQTEPFMLYLQ
jgi:hypothetical protein